MPRQRDILEPKEAEEFSRFVAYAATHWSENQSELAQLAGVSPGMISSVISGNKKAGGRTLRGVSLATGIPAEEILSGIGLVKLKSRDKSSTERASTEARLRATQALALVFNVPVETVDSIFDEIGTTLPLPHGATATTWFDVGRAALERRRQGLPLTRPLSP